MSIGQWLRKNRVESDLSLRELAEALGVNFSYISQIENYGSIPSPKILVRMAIFFDTNIDEVIKRAIKEKTQTYRERVKNRYEQARKQHGLHTRV